MMNQLLKDVISLNNEGVSCLLNGNDKIAVSTLSKSLASIRVILGVMTGDEVASSSSSPSSSPANNGATTDTAETCYHSEVILPGMPNISSSHQFVYGKAVIIIPPKCDECGMEKRVHSYSACILLNLALAHHRAAVGKNMTLMLQKAEGLYQMVRKLIQDHVSPLLHDTDQNGTAMLVNLAALNNLCHIQLRLGKQDQAGEGFKELHECLGLNETICRPLFTAEEWNGLFLNTMSQEHLFVVAAAA